jgi:hypothetical protein
MNWRLGVALLVIGGGLTVWGFIEWRLGRGASSTPQRMTLKELIARGPEGNPNIILTDFELCENYVYQSENGRWKGVYVPVVPQGEGPQSGGPPRPTSGVKAILFSINVRSEAEIPAVMGKRELPALVTNSITSLGAEETRLLQQSYGGLDPKKVLIIQEGRKLMSGALVALIFAGGGLLVLGGIGVIALSIVRGRQDTSDPPKRRRPRDEEDEERPRKRRRRDEEDEDEDDRPRKRRSRENEDEDDEPRPKRRRPRDEDDD